MMCLGKYKGQPLEIVKQDLEYCKWLTIQPWFKDTRYKEYYDYLTGKTDILPIKKQKKEKLSVERPGIVIDKYNFKTQKEATEFIRGILKSIEYSESIKTTHPEMYSLFLELCKRHPNATEKLEDIADFMVERNKMNPKAFELYIKKNSGSRIDISWNKCITQKNSTVEQDRKKAMRYAIDDQIQDFKRKNTVNICTICDTNILGEKHVDHIKTFETLVKDFEKSYAGVLPTTILDVEDGTNRHRFKEEDSDFELSWQNYHRVNASLRITCATCNLKRTKL